MEPHVMSCALIICEWSECKILCLSHPAIWRPPGVHLSIRRVTYHLFLKRNALPVSSNESGNGFVARSNVMYYAVPRWLNQQFVSRLYQFCWLGQGWVELSSLQLIYALDQPPRQTLGNTRARSSLHANGKPVLGRRHKCTAIYLRQGVQTQGLMVPTFEHWSHPRNTFKVISKCTIFFRSARTNATQACNVAAQTRKKISTRFLRASIQVL